MSINELFENSTLAHTNYLDAKEKEYRQRLESSLADKALETYINKEFKKFVISLNPHLKLNERILDWKVSVIHNPKEKELCVDVGITHMGSSLCGFKGKPTQGLPDYLKGHCDEFIKKYDNRVNIYLENPNWSLMDLDK